MNTIAGSLMAYGLSGMRYVPWAILLFMVTICLQALVSNQLQIFCVWLMPNQVASQTLQWETPKCDGYPMAVLPGTAVDPSKKIRKRSRRPWHS